MRAELEPHVHAEVGERGHGGRKLHRLPNAATPMLGGAGFARATRAGDRAEKWDASRPRREVGQCGFEGLRGRLHERMVKRMIDADKAHEDVLRLQFGGDGLERRTRSGERERARAIERRDAHGAVVTQDEVAGFVLAETDGEHGAFAARAFLHEAGALCDHPRGVLERENAGRASCGNFANAVPDNGGGLHAAGFP